jgi:hypothetical protein
MFVEVRVGGGVTVREGDDCKRLHLQATGLSTPDVESALKASEAGQLMEDGDARIRVRWLHETALSAGQVAPDWQARWDGMMAYADSSGWLSPDGAEVRVHCQYD